MEGGEIPWEYNPSLGRIKIPAGTYGQRLRNRRIALGLTLSSLASACSLTRMALRDIEAGGMVCLREIELYSRTIDRFASKTWRAA